MYSLSRDLKITFLISGIINHKPYFDYSSGTKCMYFMYERFLKILLAFDLSKKKGTFLNRSSKNITAHEYTSFFSPKSFIPTPSNTYGLPYGIEKAGLKNLSQISLLKLSPKSINFTICLFATIMFEGFKSIWTIS